MYRLLLDLRQHQHRQTQEITQDGQQISRVPLSLSLLSLSLCPSTSREHNSTTTHQGVDTKHKDVGQQAAIYRLSLSVSVRKKEPQIVDREFSRRRGISPNSAVKH